MSEHELADQCCLINLKAHLISALVTASLKMGFLGHLLSSLAVGLVALADLEFAVHVLVGQAVQFFVLATTRVH